MGVAILSGILASLQEHPKAGTSASTEDLPPRVPSRFIACVKRPESAKRVEEALSTYGQDLETVVDDNLRGLQEADVVLLGCKPWMFRDILSAEGVKEALKGKLLISILAGVPSEQIEETIYGSPSSGASADESRCTVVRAMPSTAAAVRESMTVIATSTPALPKAQADLITWIFEKVGKVVRLAPTQMDVVTSLCGSGPAFMALIMEAMADGAVAMGLPRAEAQTMAAQTMKGASQLVLNGQHPAILREKTSTPGGCTIGGLLVLEEGAVRGHVARAVREATVVASQLGMGVKNVNGTRRT